MTKKVNAIQKYSQRNRDELGSKTLEKKSKLKQNRVRESEINPKRLNLKT